MSRQNIPDEIDHKILNEIWYGKSNARTAKQIGAKVGLDTRNVRNRISKLRNFGYLIASSADNGFYYPTNKEEAMICSRQLWSRVRQIAEVARSFDKAADEKFNLSVSKVEQIAFVFNESEAS